MRKRRIAVVGGGPAGSQLSVGLAGRGYHVTLVSERNAAAVRRGPVQSAQCMFDTAIAAERDVESVRWTRECPEINSVSFGMGSADGESSTSWCAELDGRARSVDQRVKVAYWMEELVRRGGDLVIKRAAMRDVEDLAEVNDLVIIATGRSLVGQIFTPIAEFCNTEARRHHSLTYIRTSEQLALTSLCVRFISGIGEMLLLPALTFSGLCYIALVCGVPGGPLDAHRLGSTGSDHLNLTKSLFEKYWPDSPASGTQWSLSDPTSFASGEVIAAARGASGVLPSGRVVLGIADAVLVTDPTTPGQGSNTAAKAAAFYLERIEERGPRPLDRDWIENVGVNFWNAWARWVAIWARSMLGPLPKHVESLLAAASHMPGVAAEIANSFDDPARFYPWWYSSEESAAFLARQGALGSAPLSDRKLRRALGQFATGVAVVTARTASGHVAGVTANSFTSVSLDPPIVLWCVAKGGLSTRHFVAAPHFTVSVLGAGQHHLARRFALRSDDKFFGVEVRDGPGGTPIIEGATAWYRCRRIRTEDVGDHIVLFGEVEAYEMDEGVPLIFHSGRYSVTTRHPDL